MTSHLSFIKPRASRKKASLPLWGQSAMPTFWQAPGLADGAGPSGRGSAVAAENHARTMNHIRPRFATGSGRPGFLG